MEEILKVFEDVAPTQAAILRFYVAENLETDL